VTLVEDDDLEEALYARMRWNVPLSVEHAELLMDRLDLEPGAHVADLGCGWSELLLQVVARARQATGTGVHTDARALSLPTPRWRASPRRAGSVHGGRRLSVEGPADRVLCAGASHALGGTPPRWTLAESRLGGRLLFRDGY
jgi:cyclopropane fatty-acyl-phospholipid synthase-like methyltransferase